ncbi:MAG TPA: glycosyltransferase family 2 protein [Candidatus Cryosericum sp.]|nr:glycosyltransferase family 2 protein [Candidatus Cryosericum sp.]
MISILMATYNGEAFVSAQIDSLLRQTEQEFVLYMQDDCSSDGTFSILQTYQSRFPTQIRVSRNECNSGSAKHNFFLLLEKHDDEYLMFCDQDDVWQPDKIERTLCAMRQAEQTYGKETPLLVHTDLCVVDKDLKVTHPSFREMSKLDYRRTALRQLLVENTVTGCTTMVNRALRTLVSPVHAQCAMHDWWLALGASAFGHIVSLESERTVLYRQHGSNEVGAKDASSPRYVIRRLFHVRDTQNGLAATYMQAAAFANAYENRLSKEQFALLREYSRIPEHSKPGRIWQLFRLKTWKHGIVRVLGQILFV